MQGAHGQQSRAPIPNISRCAALHSDNKQKQLSRGKEEERKRNLCRCEKGAGREAEEQPGALGWRGSGGNPPRLVGEEEEDAELQID